MATEVGEVPELTEEGIIGFLVPSKNLEALIKAIKLLLDSAGLQKRITHGAYEKVKEKYSIMKYTTIDLLNLYKKLLENCS